MSSSIIRIVPQKKTERNVVPYGPVLSKFLTRRLTRAAQVIFIMIIVATPFLKLFAWGTSFRQMIWTLSLCAILILFKSKLLLKAEAPVEQSLILQFKANFISRDFLVSIAAYGISALLFKSRVAARDLSLVTIQKAEFSAHPEGIPRTLPLHQTNTWHLVHQNYLFLYGFGVFVAAVFAFATQTSNSLSTHSEAVKPGLKPLQKLVARLPHMQHMLCVYLACVVSWPVLYLLGGRTLVFNYLTFGVRKTQILTGFEFSLLLLPLRHAPLVLLWTAVQEVCLVYMNLGPTYAGKPLSEYAGPGMNSALVDGLSKPVGGLNSRFAWYELLYIAEHDAKRRISIFEDVDGDKVVWNMITREFEELIKRSTKRLNTKVEQQKLKNEKAKSEATSASDARLGAKVDVSDTPTSDQLIASNILKSLKSGAPPTHDIRPVTASPQIYRPESALQKRLAALTAKLNTTSHAETDRARADLVEVRKQLRLVATKGEQWFLHTRLGKVFARTAERELLRLTAGRQTTAFAVRAVARMVTQSLREDQLGYVQTTIGGILAALDSYTTLLEHIASSPTDYLYAEIDRPNLEVITALVREANGAFVEIIQVFHPYLDNLKASPAVEARAGKALKGELPIAETAWLA